MYIYTHLSICTHTDLHTHIYLQTCIYIYIHIHTHTSLPPSRCDVWQDFPDGESMARPVSSANGCSICNGLTGIALSRKVQ